MILPKSPVLLYAATSLRAAVVPRDCASIPSTADPATLSAVYNVVLSRNVSDRVLLATFETAWIESHANNLNCGDQDSVGVFQQRPSQGWGTVAQCTNVQYSTTSFLNAAIANDRKYPRYTPGQIAQSVQYSEFPDRYDQAEGIAKNLIAQAQRQAGMPVSTPALSASTSAPVPIISSSGTTLITTSAPLTTSSSTATATISTSSSVFQSVSSTIPATSPPATSLPPSTTPRPTSSTTAKATSTTTKKTSSTTTKKTSTSTKKSSTTSTKKASTTSTKKSTTSSTKKTTSASTSKTASSVSSIATSPAVSSFTTTTSATSTSSAAQSAPTLAPGTLDETCGALYQAATGDSCASLGQTFDATFAQLRFWNPSINAQCTNLIAGDVYCVASQVAVPPSSAASGINTSACTGYITPVQAGQTCASVGQQYGVSPNRLIQLNKSLNAACSNILVGKSYCVTSIGS